MSILCLFKIVWLLHFWPSAFQLSVTIEEDDSSSLGATEERKEIAGIVRQKMKRLDLPEEEYGKIS